MDPAILPVREAQEPSLAPGTKREPLKVEDQHRAGSRTGTGRYKVQSRGAGRIQSGRMKACSAGLPELLRRRPCRALRSRDGQVQRQHTLPADPQTQGRGRSAGLLKRRRDDNPAGGVVARIENLAEECSPPVQLAQAGTRVQESDRRRTPEAPVAEEWAAHNRDLSSAEARAEIAVGTADVRASYTGRRFVPAPERRDE